MCLPFDLKLVIVFEEVSACDNLSLLLVLLSIAAVLFLFTLVIDDLGLFKENG